MAVSTIYIYSTYTVTSLEIICCSVSSFAFCRCRRGATAAHRMIAKSLALPRGVFSFNYEQSVVVLFAIVVVGFLLWFFSVSFCHVNQTALKSWFDDFCVRFYWGPTENSHLSSYKLTCPSIWAVHSPLNLPPRTGTFIIPLNENKAFNNI